MTNKIWGLEDLFELTNRQERLATCILLHVDEKLRHPSRLTILEGVTDCNSKMNNVATICFKTQDAENRSLNFMQKIPGGNSASREIWLRTVRLWWISMTEHGLTMELRESEVEPTSVELLDVSASGSKHVLGSCKSG